MSDKPGLKPGPSCPAVQGKQLEGPVFSRGLQAMPYLLVYLAGVVIALAFMRDRWPARIGTALVWPLGPMAFLVVVPILLAAAVILWPVPVLGAAAVVTALAWLVLS
jgi:hypothetical protein